VAGNDDPIEETVVRVSPDLTGFRRKLQTDLKRAAAGVDATVKVKLEGAGNKPLFELPDVGEVQKAQNYVLGLRKKYIADQSKLVRDGNDAYLKSLKAAAEKEKKLQDDQLGQNLTNLGKRLKMLQVGQKATQDYYESERKSAKAAADEQDAALGRQLADIGKRFDLQRAGQKASQKTLDDQRATAEKAKAEEKRATTARIRENGIAVRSEQAFADFQRHISTELGKIHRARAEDEISIREDTKRRVDAIGREGNRLRIATLSAAEKIERNGLSKIEGVDKKSADRRTSLLSEAKSTFGAPKLIDFGGQGARPMTALLGAVAALTPALFSMSAAAVQASTSVVALGSAGIGAALGIGALAVSFTSIVTALKLRKSVMAAQATAAENSTSTALKNAAEELRTRNSLIDSQQAQLKAEKDLHDARVQASQDLVDMRRKVADLQNQQREDAVSLAEAEANRAAVNRNFFATALDKARANQDVNNARTKLADTGAERKKAQQDLAAGVKKGVEGSDKVTQARDQLRQARERRAEALADAKSGTAASRAAGKVTSPMAQLNQQIKDMSPAGQKMFYWLAKNEGEFKRLRNVIQQATLPGFQTFLEQVTNAPKGKNQKSTLQILAEDAGQLGAELGKTAGKAGAMTRTSFFRDSLGTIQGHNVKATRTLGDAGLTLLKPVMQLLVAASPLTEKLATGLQHVANWFSRVIDRADSSGALTQWFEDAWHNAKTLGDIGKNLLKTLGNIFKLSLPSGTSLLERLDGFTKSLADWSKSGTGQAQITKLFETFRDLPYGKIRDFFVQAAALVVGVSAVKWAAANPFWAFLGTFAASHPGAVTMLMESMTEFMVSITEQLVKHPAGAATLMALLSAAKLAKVLKVGLELPGVNALKNLLVSKFSVFDKFLGGAKTATMTVHAGIVHLYGAGVPGAVPPGGPTTVQPPGSATSGKFSRLRGLGSKAAGGALSGLTAYELLSMLVPAVTGGTDGIMDPREGAKQGALLKALIFGGAGAAAGAPFGPVGAAIGGAAGLSAGAILGALSGRSDATKNYNAIKFGAVAPGLAKSAISNAFANSQDDEGLSLDSLQTFLTDSGKLSKGTQFLDQYLKDRERSIKLGKADLETTKGHARAQQFFNTEQTKTKIGLQDLLTQYTNVGEQAGDYATVLQGLQGYGVSTSVLFDKKGGVRSLKDLKKKLAEEAKKNLVTVPVKVTYNFPLPEPPYPKPYPKPIGLADPKHERVDSSGHRIGGYDVGAPIVQMPPSSTWWQPQTANATGGAVVDGLSKGIDDKSKVPQKSLDDFADTFWQHFRNAFGVASPSTISAGVGAEVVNGLYQGFVDRWNGVYTELTGWISDHVGTPLASLFGTVGTSLRDAFVSPFSGLGDALAAPLKAAFDWINTNVIDRLNVMLGAIGVKGIDHIAFTGSVSPGAALGNAIGGAIGAGAGLLTRAGGGPVPGSSPHSKADNIPAMLTADEYVQPVDAVKHYGVGFMEAVRTKRFPKYAGGGLVGGLKAAVGDNLITKVIGGALKGVTLKSIVNNMLGSFFGGGGGTAVGDTGVAEAAEAAARALGATDKQLVALIEAGIVESGLRNLNYGDRDSIGFLQQRPSQGWGTRAQIMDVAHATRSFITRAKRADQPGQTPGQLAQAVQRSAFPDRYDQREADAVATLNRFAPLLANAGAVAGGATQQGLIDFGHWLQARGYQVTEHPLFGGVHGHVRGSKHYLGRAIDVNHGAGTSAVEQAWLAKIIPEAHRRGFHTIFNAPGHYDHAHIDYANGGLVPRRKYDTGGTLPPGYTLAFNGTGRNETVRTASQEQALSGPIRLDRRDILALARHIAGAASPTVHMDGQKVAEIANTYTYLPAGV
jgi:hypothetical protein